MSRLKRIPTVVSAFAALHRVHPSARLVIAGRADDSSILTSVIRAVTAAGLERVVRVLVDPRGDRFEAGIDASDVVVNLRWPTAGETSGAMMRAFGAGKPVITSVLPQHEALPPSFCWRIPVDEEGEGRGLYEEMSAAVRDREGCRKAGQAARALVERFATWRTAADRYVEVLGGTVARHAGAPHQSV